MSISNHIYTSLFGKLVGKDEFGNKYYIVSKTKRWVIYKGLAEASKVPPEWHRWLHKTTNDIPQNSVRIHSWTKSHLPNLTGTIFAYLPTGHILSKAKRNKATGDYVAWQPQEKI